MDNNLPDSSSITKKIKKLIDKKVREVILDSAIAILILSFIFGFIGGIAGLIVGPVYIEKLIGENPFKETIVRQFETRVEVTDNEPQVIYEPQTTTEETIIGIVEGSSQSVVSVVATKDLPVFEDYFVQDDFFSQFFPEFQVPRQRQNGTERQEVSSGTGFVAASNFVITNKHVVSDIGAEFTVVTSGGDKFPATVLARDPIEDLAILKVEGLNLPSLRIGNSDSLAQGQTVIAIGNALGEFQNSVSVGVVSGLKRTLTADGPSGSQILREVIQTDAAINPGNSGGPLINLSGEVIGVNVAIVQNAQNIGFSVPINRISDSLQQAITTGEVKFPFLGVRYILITPDVAEQNALPVDYGALVLRGPQSAQIAVVLGSAADKAGVVENDIILEVNDQRITASNLLADVIGQYKVGESIKLKILHDGEERTEHTILGERP